MGGYAGDRDGGGSLNDRITKGGDMRDMVLVQEALQEKKIAQIAEEIAGRREAKFVLIAGPSSSGKTTFSHRLSIQLRAAGMVPHPDLRGQLFCGAGGEPQGRERGV